ncbi:MAG: type III-B CRISPR-associated protein Cas10/Cmr2 [Nitrospira sp.]|nr:type III-B CRISPR-associated protein Cas10/Cmr2 [Nitrospira sp.]
MNNELLWQTKLAARLHDPAEKALVLLRDPAGHEGGSIVEVGKALGFPTHHIRRRDGSTVEKLQLADGIERIVEQADHWAAAADRAQFPKDTNERFVEWAQVRFADEGELVHPLSGERYEVRSIGQQVLAEHIKAVSGDHFKRLIHNKPDGAPDFRLTALAFWRFGPELGRELKGIGPLWNLLPADTRTPDHTIWQHLDLTSALAGAMASGSRPALLTLSIGPVQDFIAAARSTSDLWAGSHFLSTLAWQAMKVVAQKYGPDAILFPQLRAVPMVDLWLIEEGVQAALFEKADWNDTNTDYNPLFVAALPNKFVAIVPEGDAAPLANQIRQHLRQWVQDEAGAMLDRVLREIGEQPQSQHCYHQLEEQLRDFPEVHWSVVPWLDEANAEAGLAAFSPAGKQPPFLRSEAWKLLKKPIEPAQGWRFCEPNDGILYPAVHELSERTLSSAKSARPFSQLIQNGYRDSLTGEYEWLTLDERQLTERSPRQRTDTLWAKVSSVKPSWAKEGEHLSAFGLIKRLWPEQFTELVKSSQWYKGLAEKPDLSRYVISTHIMALAPSLEQLMEEGPVFRRLDDPTEREKTHKAYQWLVEETKSFKRPALPRRLMRKEFREREWWDVATRLPALIEQERARVEDEQEEASVSRIVTQIETAISQKTERYYGLLLMDGDRLGQWLSGEPALLYKEVFHTRVAEGLQAYNHEDLRQYLEAPRPSSPARHMAISSALNGFALDLVRHVVEEECLGKVLYAGGDDVMAMVCVRDLPNAMALLRVSYSGGVPDGRPMPSLQTEQTELDLKRGFVQVRGRLYQVMGTKATASCGAVIAHHQAPLAMVLRELRAAERRAKKEGGRDAFSITVIKRSGGVLALTAKWGEPLEVLLALRDFLADPAVSRRAVYNSLVWLTDLPSDASVAMLGSLLGYQFKRQTASDTVWNKHDGSTLCRRIAALACQEKDRLDWLTRFMGVAEFLAREARTGGVK